MKFNTKKIALELADLAGVTVESPTNESVSWVIQTSPEESRRDVIDPGSPLGGDEEFFSFMIPGSVFRALDGSEWEILTYEWNGRVEIENRWYTTVHANVPVADIRRSIHSWIDPFHLVVPPPLPGVDYK